MKEVRVVVQDKKSNQQIDTMVGHKKEQGMLHGKALERQLSINETAVPLLPPELKRWIKVIRPSRASLTYERME